MLHWVKTMFMFQILRNWKIEKYTYEEISVASFDYNFGG